jgi:putative FmdB family regulatory protein
MPFYEYTCARCGHHHEELQKVSDPPLKKCPECGKNSLTRLVSAPVFRLKGGGWYETDFKSDQEAKRNLAVEKDKEPAAKPDEAAKPAAETKPEAPAKAADKPSDKPSGKTTVAVRKPPAAKAPAKKPIARKPAGRKAAPGRRR